MVYKTVSYNGLHVTWLPELDGGGRDFGQDFVPVVQHLFGRVGRVFEFCAGPGFIGFSLLANGLCDSLALGDVNPRAIAAIHQTIQRNGLSGKVDVYRSDGLAAIPGSERWDLVVANPPHFLYPSGDSGSLLSDDASWALHRRFYEGVGQFLAPGGSVLIQEYAGASRDLEFLPMLAAGGLCYVQTVWHSEHPEYYFLWSKLAVPGIALSRGKAPWKEDIRRILGPLRARTESHGAVRVIRHLRRMALRKVAHRVRR